jgi:hypothetical protein
MATEKVRRRAAETRTVSRTRRKSTSRGSAGVEIYQLKITLLGSEPPIWRRFAVPADITLAKLHDAIQIVMGWYDCHLHEFRTRDGTRYRARDPGLDLDWDAGTIDERKAQLHDVIHRAKQRLFYDYDFGDGWEHGLELEKRIPPEPNVKYPVCLAGERACPPEDCGGIWGYGELIEAIRDPKHERHEELLEWLGDPFDPEAFDLEETNALLRKLR